MLAHKPPVLYVINALTWLLIIVTLYLLYRARRLINELRQAKEPEPYFESPLIHIPAGSKVSWSHASEIDPSATGVLGEWCSCGKYYMGTTKELHLQIDGVSNEIHVTSGPCQI